MKVDPQKVAALIAEIAADVIEPKFGRLARSEVRRKSSAVDLVTEVDEAAERALEKGLHAIRPDAAFVGEEKAARAPDCLKALSGEDAVWVVDPLDGTRNFVQGVREFGSIVAFVEGGETRMGWIHAIPDRVCAFAVRGEGAVLDGERLRPDVKLRRPYAGFRSLGWLDEARRERIRANLARHFESRPAHCSAYAYLKLARGEADFKISSRIHPWDHLAGALLLEEAGGRASFLDDGKRLSPMAGVDRPFLAVAPGRDWAEIARLILD
ncbi:inositol monophosphatase family protein [Amphiplicatus metriothermophilus]|uniref:Fructose-1,6-bisphosphatase n=1 Tax=Amphiplicatus metriothermophilus TaxID=1519374 RepID=A0A239PXG3_9PROT|nr:inositol monophosphatase [Amphiplicatus metriothermophilus]MBB5519969.1 fructose-1,6-bisphosphatase/inositol monophosphatase family enzyme [Amphiplicatus metriothermophilus]SNT74870.1 fructose-1,6-bisphosphatase [Amphiplicatus metriothermophilus]